MEIQEALIKKEQLEEKITYMINKFIKETGIPAVSSVDIVSSRSVGYPTEDVVSVKLRIEL